MSDVATAVSPNSRAASSAARPSQHALEEVFEVALLDPVPVVVSDDEVLFALELLQVLFGRLLVSEQQVAKNIDGIAVGNLGIPVSD